MIETELAYKEHLYKQNQERIKEQEKQYAYYSGDSDKVIDYLKKALEITYASEDIEEMQLNYINLTKKMIDQMAVVYREPASRYFESLKPIKVKDEQGNEITDDKAQKELTMKFNSILPTNMNSIDKEAHRLAKLSNCSLTFIKVDKKNKTIKYVINPIHKYDIGLDEDGGIEELKYKKYFRVGNQDELFTVVWTKDKYYLVDELGNETALKDNPDKTNPYGEIPASLLKINLSDDIYGEGQNDLINISEQINLLLTKLVNSDIILGTEGTTLAINLGFHKKSRIDGSDVFKEVRTGKKHPISVDNVRATDLVPPSLQHVTTTPYINEVKDFIDWYIKFIASMKGLNPSAILAQLKDTSDYQKIMDAIDQMEMRKDDLEACRIYEKERYRLTKLVWNTHAQELDVEQLKDEGFEFKVDFAEIGIHKTIQDEQAEFEFQLKYNLITPAEYLMAKNPDLTLEQAKEIIAKNKKENDALAMKKTRLESLINVADTTNI